MAIPQRISFLVAHGLEELVDPDGSIDGEALLVQRFDLDWPRAGLQNGPEAGDTHSAILWRRAISFSR